MLGLLRYEPFRKMVHEFDQSVGKDPAVYRNEEPGGLCVWSPKMDVNEREHEFAVRMDIPGMKQEDIHVTVENNHLTISGERLFEHDEKKDNYHRVERCHGAFSRSFSLPRTVDAGKISASYKDGVLEMTLPKREESKPKAVEIKIG